MTEYELINPSDPYTFEAEDFETAALVVLALGPAYGARPKTGADEVPVFLFADPSEWYKEKFGRTPEEGLKVKSDSLADALESMMLGRFEDRERYNAALEAIDDAEKRACFISKWQDGCSSLNNIGKAAHKLGAALRQSKRLDHEKKA